MSNNSDSSGCGCLIIILLAIMLISMCTRLKRVEKKLNGDIITPDKYEIIYPNGDTLIINK